MESELPSFASVLERNREYTDAMNSGCESDTHEPPPSCSPGCSRNNSNSPLISSISSTISIVMANAANWSSSSSTMDTPSVSPPPVQVSSDGVESSCPPHMSHCSHAVMLGAAVKLANPSCGMSDVHTIALPPRLALPPINLGSNSPNAHTSTVHHANLKEEKLGANRVGGVDWVHRRKTDTLNKAYHHGTNPKQLQIAQVRKAVDRLQGALPTDAKAIFLRDIRRYLAGEITPEDFAETMKKLVDDYGVVIPLNDMPVGGYRKSEHVAGRSSPPSDTKQATKLGKRGASGPLKGTAVVHKKLKEESSQHSTETTSRNAAFATSPANSQKKPSVITSGSGRRVRKLSSWGSPRKTPSPEPAAPAAVASACSGNDNSAWEALLSVCSGISA